MEGNTVPVAVVDRASALAKALHVVLPGISDNTRIGVGRVRVFEGVLTDVHWTCTGRALDVHWTRVAR